MRPRSSAPTAVIATLGGQTAINLAEPLRARGVNIIGTDCKAIERAENRDAFEKLLISLNIPQPKGQAVTSIEAGIKAAEEIGYPVLVRPSFVLGGRAMQIVAKEEALQNYLKTDVEIDEDKPVLVDKYIRGKEVEVDAVCDGKRVFVPGIIGLFNIQFIVDEYDNVYIIEVNPRSSRTVPFLSKATGFSLADIATRCNHSMSLPKQEILTSIRRKRSVFM